MNKCEPQADGTTRTVCSLGCAQQPPGTSMPSLFPDYTGHDQNLFNYTPALLLDPAICNGSWLTENEEQHLDGPLQNSLRSFTEHSYHELDGFLNNFFIEYSPTNTNQEDYGASSLSMQTNSFGSDSTVLARPRITSTPEHDGEESIGTVLSVDSVSGSLGCKTCKVIEVWPVSACRDHRSRSSSEVPNRFKGVKKKKNSDKWTCQIRISRKIPKDNQLRGRVKGKLWLGTYATCDQVAQALDVGKYLLSIKNKKKKPKPAITVFDRNTESMLSKFKNHLHAQPLDEEHLESVRKLANHYGKNGSLYGFSF